MVTVALSLCVFLGSALDAAAQGTITVAWNPNPEPDIAGYVVEYGASPGVYTAEVDVGNQTSYTLSGLIPGATYYIVVRAYTQAGLQGPRSAEVVGVASGIVIQPSYTLTITQPFSGTGAGTVTATGVNCPGDCSEAMVENTVVALTATPAADSTFVSWGGAADCADGTVTMIADRTCTASFSADDPGGYTLTITQTGTGTGIVTSSPPGIDCGADCTESYASGAVVTLTAVPAADSTFAGWGGDGDCADGTVTMASARACTASFPIAPAEPVPSPWVAQDIGSVGLAGSASYASGTFTVRASGADIWGTADAFHYVSQPLIGDGEIVARVLSLDNTTSPWAKVGVMIRETAAADARHAAMVINASNGAAFMTRATPGGPTSSTADFGSEAVPSWVKLARSGDTFTAYHSTDGVNWVEEGNATVAMVETVSVGLAVVSLDNSLLGTATLDQVVLGAPPPPCTYTIAPTSAAVAATGGVGSVAVTTGSGCDWTATTSDTWITITAGATGSGSGTVSYSVAPSVTTSSRTGSVTIGDQTLAVTQAGAAPSCTFSISPTTASAGSGGGAGTVTVATNAGCSWTATSNASWLTVTAGASGSGNGAVSYAVALNASPQSRSDVLTIAGNTFTVTQAGASYLLTVTQTGTGTGTVTSSPLGIDCGADCTESYASGAVVTLTAVPAADSTFAGWGGAADCAADGRVTMTAAVTCAATFDRMPPPTHVLTITQPFAGTGAGTVTATGVNCPGDCSEAMVENTVVALTATPAADSTFVSWGGAADCADGRVTMTAAVSCAATFDRTPPPTHVLTITQPFAGTGAGTVTATGVNCPGDCSEAMVENTVVALTATPAADSTFVSWGGAADCADGRVTMTAAVSCAATFDRTPPPTHVLTITQPFAGTGAGTVTATGISCPGDCSEAMVENTVVALTATPAADSTFVSWGGAADLRRWPRDDDGGGELRGHV